MEPPRLPWEVIERIIEKSYGSARTLRNFSLTCSQLLPRSHCVLFARVKFRGKDEVFSFVDFLQNHPHLKPLVHSIVILDPTDFPPFPLLHILSNLSEVGFTSQNHNPILHHSTLTCVHRFGTHVRTLRLFNISFATCLPFARILLAFPNMVHLICNDVKIEKTGDRVLLNVLKRRLSKQMRLKALTTNCLAPQDDDKASVGDLLLDSNFELAPSTVESLTMLDEPMPDLFLRQSDWPRLQSLVLRVPCSKLEREFPKVLQWLREFQSHRTLKEVSLELRSAAFGHLLNYINPRRRNSMYEQLQQALLPFSHPRITWIISNDFNFRANTKLLWASELQKKHRDSALSRHGTVKLVPGADMSIGHNNSVDVLAVSSNGKLVASGSEDSTIIIWSIQDGSVVQQWVAHNYQPVQAITFSPDSRYLVSGGKEDNNVALWDVSRDACKIEVLVGHTSAIAGCAWSPANTVIASGDSSGIVRTWDASTFHPLHVLDTTETMSYNLKEQIQVTFTSDGRWLGSVSRTQYCIWDPRSGTLHKVIGPESPTGYIRQNSDRSVPFDAQGIRIAAISWSGVVEIYSIEEQPGGQFIFRPPGGTNEVSFSPDGRLLLAAMKDGTIRVWDTSTGAQVFQLKGHTREVSTACFSPCGRYIASASWDSTVRLWGTSDGACMGTSTYSRRVTRLAFSLDGDTVMFGREDGLVIWKRVHDRVVPVRE